MQNKIDLRPLYQQRHAARMVLLARGQLNRACRKHGLLPLDLFMPGNPALAEDIQDDPAALGVEQAAAAFGEPFWEWAYNLPAILIQPILDILVGTWRLDGSGHGIGSGVGREIMAAHQFLLGRLELSGAARD